MKWLVKGVAASSAWLFADLVMPPPSWGQPGPAAEPRPYLYLWGAPTTGWGADLTPYASQMVSVFAEHSAREAACGDHHYLLLAMELI